MTRGEFARRLLDKLIAPESRHNRCALQAWFQVEHAINDETREAANNPLNSTLKLRGSTNFNDLGDGIGVQNYPTPRAGIEATLRTLNQANFEPIRAHLQYNALPSLTLQEVANSDWGTDGRLLALVLPDVQRDLELYEKHPIAKWTP